MTKEHTLIMATLPFAHENKVVSWFHTLSTLVILLISLTLVLMDINFILNLFLSVFSGLVIVRLFVICHDFLHGSIHNNSKIANALFTVFGYYILVPKTAWRRSHNYHHSHNSKLIRTGIGSFPVYTKSRFEKLSSKEQKKYLFIRSPLAIVFGYYFTFFNGMCLQSLIKSFKKNKDSLFAILFHITLHVTVFVIFGWQTFIWFSFIPHLISGAIGAYLFYVQHNFPEVTYIVDNNWTYEDAALKSTCCLKTNRFMHWVTANIGYHHIHHLNPKIPYYRLPETMRMVKEFQNPKIISLNVKDIRACLMLKYWDTKLNKMTGLTEKVS